ncbi:MAG: nucleotidyltransferase family protein [Phycisphaerales bacterium]|nr:MAG: nucleotidyltransferase family protein [Phycisphaerales bacterium]
MEFDNEQLSAWLGGSDQSQRYVPDSTRAWFAFADHVRRAGLAGLVLESAAKRDVTLPSFVTDSLRHAAMSVAANNIHTTRELEGPLAALNRAKIPVMLLKGAALNLSVYDRPDLRPTSDADLLIHPDSAVEALRVLETQGCRRGADLLREDFFPKYFYETELLTGSTAPVRIDLHARPFRPLRLARTVPDDALWEGARTVRVGKTQAIVPRPELMLIHLAGHAAYHGCERLLWLYDIRRFVEHHRESLDWSHFTRCAKNWRLSWPVLTALTCATGLFGSTCPDGVAEELASHRISWRDRLALRQAPRDATSPIAHFLVDLLCTPGIAFRLGYAQAVLLPTAKHLAGVYPYRHRGWLPVAQVWRSLRAAGRAFAGAFNSFSRALGYQSRSRKSAVPR